MPRPTDPVKLAALRARQAAASARYRARKRASAAAAAGGHVPAVAREITRAEATRRRRQEIISALPDVRNPAATIRVVERTPRAAPVKVQRAAQRRQAEALRESIRNGRVTAYGKNRQETLVTELYDGQHTSAYLENMDTEQRIRFQELSESIARHSRQSLGILFRYAGGQDLYTYATGLILASPKSRDVEEGLSQLALLAEYAESAGREYGPSRIGRLNI